MIPTGCIPICVSGIIFLFCAYSASFSLPRCSLIGMPEMIENAL